MTIALGIASRRFPIGLFVWDKSLGDALYTVMLYFITLLARPTLRPSAAGAAALSLSVAIELFQLTEVPARLPRALQIALGTTFAWHDIACYVVGALVAVAAHRIGERG
ncbi:MAG: DUF2809 domain-containing protein [Labilithrix sp.]|nr:DUF2809 domain-containing protein [Labilithrix sp.]